MDLDTATSAQVTSSSCVGFLSALQLHFLENVFLRSLDCATRQQEKKAQLAALARVPGGDDADIEAIAFEKLIRCKLLWARQCLKVKNDRMARSLAEELIADLQSRALELPYLHRSRLLIEARSILAKTKNSGGAEGIATADGDISFSFESARRWYQEHRLPGFRRDFSGEFEARYWMARAAESAPNVQECVMKALEACEQDRVFASTRTSVLYAAAGYSHASGSSELTNAVFNSWKVDGHKFAVGAEHSQLAAMMLGPALSSGSNENYNSAFIEALSSASSAVAAQSMVDNYLLHQTKLQQWPPRNRESAQLLLANLDSIVGICAKRNLVDFELQAARVECLLVSEEYRVADKIVDRELAPRLLKRIRPKDERIVAEALIAFASNLRNRNSALLAKKDADQAACAILHEALKSRKWSAFPRAHLLTKLAEMAGGSDLAPLKQQCERELETMAKAGYVDDPNIAFHAIVSLSLSGKVASAELIYKNLKEKLKGDPKMSADIDSWLLGHLRAFPNYSVENLRLAKQGRFPDAVFQSVPERVLTKEGASSPEYGRALLYLAQYELCRGNEAAMCKLCRQLISSASTRSNAFVLPARFLSGDNLLSSVGANGTSKLRAARGSIYELECLRSIFLQLNRNEEATRLKALQARIVEE